MNFKETPLKYSTKVNEKYQFKQDDQTIDTCTFGQRSGKSSVGQQFILENKTNESLDQIKRNIFVDSFGKQTTQQQQRHSSQEQFSETDYNNDSDDEQIEILTQQQYQSILTQDIMNLKELQWLIKKFNSNNKILNKYTSKVVNKVENYLRKSILKTEKSNKIQFEQYLLDEITVEVDIKKQNNKETQQFTLICNQYILYSKQSIAKCLQPQFAPYKQQYLQSILLVIDDMSTFKKLANDDLRNQICQIIEQIEKNMIGKDQKKYTRQVYKNFVNYVFKKMQQQEKICP